MLKCFSLFVKLEFRPTFSLKILLLNAERDFHNYLQALIVWHPQADKSAQEEAAGFHRFRRERVELEKFGILGGRMDCKSALAILQISNSACEFLYIQRSRAM
jgi:hypothetical protein